MRTKVETVVPHVTCLPCYMERTSIEQRWRVSKRCMGYKGEVGDGPCTMPPAYVFLLLAADRSSYQLTTLCEDHAAKLDRHVSGLDPLPHKCGKEE